MYQETIHKQQRAKMRWKRIDEPWSPDPARFSAHGTRRDGALRTMATGSAHSVSGGAKVGDGRATLDQTGSESFPGWLGQLPALLVLLNGGEAPRFRA